MRRKKIWIIAIAIVMLATGTLLYTNMKRQVKTSYVNGRMVSVPKSEPAFYYCKPEKKNTKDLGMEKV